LRIVAPLTEISPKMSENATEAAGAIPLMSAVETVDKKSLLRNIEFENFPLQCEVSAA
jgi:hypothetical protein